MIFNPVIPVPALIAAAAAAVLLSLIAWIRSRENRILSAFTFFVRAGIVALSFVIALRPMREAHGTDVQLSNRYGGYNSCPGKTGVTVLLHMLFWTVSDIIEESSKSSAAGIQRINFLK